MAVFFWYLVKRDLFSVHWTSHLSQGTRKTHPVGSEIHFFFTSTKEFPAVYRYTVKNYVRFVSLPLKKSKTKKQPVIPQKNTIMNGIKYSQYVVNPIEQLQRMLRLGWRNKELPVKVIFFNGQSTKAFSPPSRHSVQNNCYKFKKNIFSPFFGKYLPI